MDKYSPRLLGKNGHILVPEVLVTREWDDQRASHIRAQLLGLDPLKKGWSGLHQSFAHFPSHSLLCSTCLSGGTFCLSFPFIIPSSLNTGSEISCLEHKELAKQSCSALLMLAGIIKK